jgi:response regulator of citrate/malate metabolism
MTTEVKPEDKTVERKIQRDVLIIDDDKAVCDVLKQYCESLNIFKNIILAHDGLMASSKLRNQKFALILLDMNLPKKSGLDLIGEVADSDMNRKDSVIVVSGTLEKEIIAKILGSGVKNFIVKPIDEAAFKDKVMKVLNIKP